MCRRNLGPHARGSRAPLLGIAGVGHLICATPSGVTGPATAAGTVTLPPVLGGGTAKITFTTTVNKGLSDIKVSVGQASS